MSARTTAIAAGLLLSACVSEAAASGTSLRAEVVEADTIRVHTLHAITLDVRELHAPKVQRVDHYPVAKDEGMVRLEGHRVEADRLEAHHVRARVLIADEVVVHRMRKLRGSPPWPRVEGSPEVVNRCVALGDGAASERCLRGAF